MSVAIDHGYLPSSRYIINHDVMHGAADREAGSEYSGRALGLSEPCDLIQLHPDLRPLWDDICAHYDRIGLRHTEQAIWHVHRAELGEHIGYQPSVFCFGPQECLYWGDNAWLDVVEFVNSKNDFIATARELGIDVPRTLCVDSASHVTHEALDQFVFPCLVKAAVPVSGVGTHRCRDASELRGVLLELGDAVPLQIQEELVAERFLNLQYRVIGDDVIRLAASEQMLDGFNHQGSRVPASHEPWASVDPLAHWLKDHGMKGVFAFDVAVVNTDRGPRFPAIECSPCYHEASYSTAIAHKLGIRAWSSMALSTRFRALKDIDLSGIEFDGRNGQGVILVNWGAVLRGRLLVLFAGSPDYQHALMQELANRL